MMATLNSMRWRAAIAIVMVSAGITRGSEADWAASAAFAKTEFQRAEAQFHANMTNATNAWQFARAAFDLAEFLTNDTERAMLADQGIGASRMAIACDPKNAAGHYYLAMNLGQRARTEFLGALRLVREMEREFQTAAKLDARLDYAGPERNLGLLYREAPGWPLSIGSNSKSKPCSERAVQLAPGYPENYLNLIESYLKWNEPDAAKMELRALDAVWPAARTNFTGAKWAQAWENWSARRDTARKQFDKDPAPPPNEPGK
jgi:hypothetical protein